MNKGLVIKSISGEYTVYDKGEKIICKPRGVFRHKEKNVKVGDRVIYDKDNKIIYEIEKRYNDLTRPVISNVEKGIIVTSVIEPALNLNLLDKIIAVLEYNQIKPILIFTKIDLLKDKDCFNNIFEYYQSLGYNVVKSSDEELYDKITELVGSSICFLVGQSGVGKSTLLNKLDITLSLKINEISKALGRGKHTTKHIELFPFGNGFIADSPGFGSIDLENMSLLSLSQSFKEFFENSTLCKYAPCFHINEPNCEIKKLVNEGKILKSRYDNYLQFACEIIKREKNKY